MHILCNICIYVELPVAEGRDIFQRFKQAAKYSLDLDRLGHLERPFRSRAFNLPWIMELFVLHSSTNFGRVLRSISTCFTFVDDVRCNVSLTFGACSGML